MKKNQETPPYYHFMAPRYWLTWIGLSILYLFHRLPFRWQKSATKKIIKIARPLVKRREHIARRNLELCFPEKSATEIEELLQAHFESLGSALAETAMAWWGSDQQIRDLGQLEGIEHLKQAQNSGKGLIMLTGHFTTLELANRIIGRHTTMAGMYRPLKNKLMDKFMIDKRFHFGATGMFKRNEIRALTHTIRKGGAIWFGFDQNYGQRHVFAPFFGVPAATITSTARFAQLGRALVVPFFPRRNADGSYTVEVLAPLENFPSGDDVADTRRLNELLEQAVIKAPDQYLWIHRRFKTRPEGEASVY